MKKLLAGFLAVLMTVSVWGNTAFADSEYVAQEKTYSYAPVQEEKMGAASPNADYLDYYVDVDELKEYLFAQLAICNESINIYNYRFPANQSVFDALSDFIFYEIPEAFHVFQVGATTNGSYIKTLNIDYEYSSGQFAIMYQDCVKEANKLLDGIIDDPYLTDTGKALLIHDRIAAKCEYDVSLSEDNIYDMYGVLVKNKAVCQGYSEAYIYLLEQVGIDSYPCSSDLLNHMWNIVYIGGEKFHVDITWDDPTYDITGRVNHDNFLRSTSGIIETGHHKYGVTDFDTTPTNTVLDDMFWQDSHTEFQLVNNNIYYIDNEAEQLMMVEDDSDVVLYGVKDTWPASASSDWIGNFSRLSSDGENLFISMQDAIYEYDLSTGAARIVYQPSLSSYYSIFGFTYKDGYLICDLNNSPNFTSSTKKYNQKKIVYDNIKPTASISSTNNVADRQQVTLSFSDNAGIAGYYWGTSPTYTNNYFHTTSQTRTSVVVYNPGIYYLAVKDTSGNVSDTVSMRFYKTTLYPEGGTVSGANKQEIITPAGQNFTAPVPVRSGYTFKGWSTDWNATSGIQVITPVNNASYYAVWEEVQNDNPPILEDTPVEQFVTRLYNVCLNREPDAGGKKGWVNNLESGRSSGIQAANGFIFSPEFKNKNYCNEDFVKQLYRAFMGREADASGLAGWVRNLNGGMTREAVFNGFALSREFRNLCAEYGIRVGGAIKVPKYGTLPTGCCSECGAEDGVTAFVKRLYSVCLDREADAGGLASWSKQLWNHTLGGRKVAQGFIFSKEFTNKNYSNKEFVEHLYLAFMGRQADAGGLAGWVRNLEHGMSRKQVFDGFAGSKEFTNICNQYGILRD